MLGSRRDRVRVETLSRQAAENRDLAAAAPTEQGRLRYLRTAKNLERIARARRTYPLSIWLAGASVILVELPLVILMRHGQPILGLASSALAVVTMTLLKRRWNSKHPLPKSVVDAVE